MGLDSLAQRSSNAMRKLGKVQLALVGQTKSVAAGVSLTHSLQRVKLGGAPLSRTQLGSPSLTAGTSNRSSAARPSSHAKAVTRGMEELRQYAKRTERTCSGILCNLLPFVNRAKEVTTLKRAPPRAYLVYEVNMQLTQGALRVILVNPDSSALATQSCSSLQ